jgi:3-oxoacyl-[acyl-carrier-protein] synthase III
MANAKKASKKGKPAASAAKKSAKTTAAKRVAGKTSKPTRTKKSKVERPLLTDEAKARLLKPPTDYLSLVERVLSQWSEHKSTLKLANSSPAKLRSQLAAARKARAKEEALRAQMEKRLAPLVDARLLADDGVWRQTLDLYALAKAQGRVLPQVAEAFGFLADVYKRSAKESEEPKPGE